MQSQVKPGEGGYGRNAERPLETDAVVVDETSMLDIVLCHHLLQAVPRHASVLFVGDADQLPSVGPGKFLGGRSRVRSCPLRSPGAHLPTGGGVDYGRGQNPTLVLQLQFA